MSLDRTRLARVLAMIGSSFDGEALVAARRAHELVKAAGLSWEELLTGKGSNRQSGAWVEPLDDAEKIDRCLEHAEYLTEWEQDFIDNLAGWHGRLTPKQSRRLDELVGKVRRIARTREHAA